MLVLYLNSADPCFYELWLNVVLYIHNTLRGAFYN